MPERLDVMKEGRHWRYLLAAAILVAVAMAVLHALGRNWWCSARDLRVWSSDIVSMHNSQHLLDPYTLTHLLHGIGFYGLFWLICRHWTTPFFRGVLAVGVESAWEVFENTSFVIEKYREETIALGYYGDSVVNSLGDITACALGYVLAMLVPVWASFTGFLLTEVFLLWWIRDSLLVNILMLIWPIEALKNWQAGP